MIKTHSNGDEHNHQRALGNCRGIALIVAREEGQRAKANLLNIQSDKDVIHRFGGEQSCNRNEHPVESAAAIDLPPVSPAAG
jgi:hypothetical protein